MESDIFIDNNENLLLQNQDIVFFTKNTSSLFALRNFLRKNKLEILKTMQDPRDLYALILKKALELNLSINDFIINLQDFQKGIINVEFNLKGDKESA